MAERDDWKRLVEALDAWTAAAEVAPGRIEVSVPHRGGIRDVVIVMTPEEWEDDVLGVMWGNDFDGAVEEVKRVLLRLRWHQRFAVYAQYTLEASTEPTLRAPVLDRELRGEWVVQDREGRVISRFRDWSESDERRRRRRGPGS